jgi:hypothetical protein
LTAPEVRPLTSCFWVSHPTITGTIIARLVNAESLLGGDGDRQRLPIYGRKHAAQPGLPDTLGQGILSGRVLYVPDDSRTNPTAAT